MKLKGIWPQRIGDTLTQFDDPPGTTIGDELREFVYWRH